MLVWFCKQKILYLIKLEIISTYRNKFSQKIFYLIKLEIISTYRNKFEKIQI